MATDETEGPNKAVVTAAAIVAGLIASKAFVAIWKVVRGRTPDDDDDSPLLETVLFAAASAATVAAARNLVSHRAEQHAKNRTASS